MDKRRGMERHGRMKKIMIMAMVQKNGRCVRVVGDKTSWQKKKEPVAAGSKVKDK